MSKKLYKTKYMSKSLYNMLYSSSFNLFRYLFKFLERIKELLKYIKNVFAVQIDSFLLQKQFFVYFLLKCFLREKTEKSNSKKINLLMNQHQTFFVIVSKKTTRSKVALLKMSATHIKAPNATVRDLISDTRRSNNSSLTKGKRQLRGNDLKQNSYQNEVCDFVLFTEVLLVTLNQFCVLKI